MRIFIMHPYCNAHHSFSCGIIWKCWWVQDFKLQVTKWTICHYPGYQQPENTSVEVRKSSLHLCTLWFKFVYDPRKLVNLFIMHTKKNVSSMEVFLDCWYLVYKLKYCHLKICTHDTSSPWSDIQKIENLIYCKTRKFHPQLIFTDEANP